MKVLFFYLLSALVVINALNAQSANLKEVPAKLKDAFTSKYASASIKKWSFKNNVYTANFIFDGKKSTAFYDVNGGWIRTETNFGWTWKLPIAVKNGFYKSEFATWFIEKMKKYETPESTFYRFLIDNGDLLDGDHHDAFLEEYISDFSANGRLICKTERQ